MSAADEQSIASKFNRWGWLGVWVQAVLAILPLVMLCYFLLGKATGSGTSLGFMDYLALVGLAILGFTTF